VTILYLPKVLFSGFSQYVPPHIGRQALLMIQVLLYFCFTELLTTGLSINVLHFPPCLEPPLKRGVSSQFAELPFWVHMASPWCATYAMI